MNSCKSRMPRNTNLNFSISFSDLMRDEDSMRTFRVKVKPCPLCKEKIDKSWGCNAMSCRCGHHFCWLCLKPNPYSHHDCQEIPMQVMFGLYSDLIDFLLFYCFTFIFYSFSFLKHHHCL